MKAKTLRHNLERTWRRSRTHLDRSRYKQQCHLCKRMMTKAKSKYLADVIAENSDNPRRLWNSINNILHRIPPLALPEFTSVKSLCDHFSRHFVDKIETIRSKFPDKVQNIPQVQKPEIRSKMNVFERASEDEIKKLILSSSSKSCDLDPMPTSVLKNCLDILLTPITDIINISMETSTFPQNFKEAHVRPLLKKTSLPKNELKNYRPVSNLSFISKILEKIVANRLQAHIKNKHLCNPLQSAYRKHHSTESALLKVHNDIINSMDKGEVTALTLLDLSAAFDTIDHATLTDRFSDWYGISGQAQIWFSSYLQNRLQSVKIKDTFSDKVTLSYGVPQGSVLGPVLFTLHTTPLSAIISSFDINHHLYADDTQIYMSLSVSNAKESLEKLQHCLMGVSAWMTRSKLKLNPSMTEFLLIGTKLQREKFLNNFPCLLLGQKTNTSKKIGVLFDSSLNFRKHISQTCRACFYHIRDLRRIRKSLSLDIAKQIAVALVNSKLD